ncbi:hypothetical protein QFC24_001644 [Naganishia onofrii]|uniref:Uncharacterized protein n=1 Tax=Naganishia onofrii TaxID=1851511 RepID=A0ACC2XTD1_9TREE|nr:hypothetical protein QFC24_001644 [Naganishia onofrii]
MLDSYETSCRLTGEPDHESIGKLNAIVANQLGIMQMQDRHIRTRDMHVQQMQTVHYQQTTELKQRLGISESDLNLAKDAANQLRYQKNELQLQQRKELAELQKVQAQRDDLLFEADKLMREHVMAMGTLKLVHAAELRKERDQRKESDQETELRLVLPGLSPEQASVNGELKARVHSELAVFGNPEVEKRSFKTHSGNVYIDNQTNEFVQETESTSPDQALIIRDLKAKIDAQAEAIRELEREKRSLQEECERLDSEGEIVGVAGRGGGQHVDGAPKLPQRRAGRSKGSKNRVSSARSLTSPPIIDYMSLPEESDIFQGLSGRQVLQLKRKLKNNLITKAQAREEAMRLRSGGEAIVPPAPAATSSGSSEPTMCTDERTSSDSSLLGNDGNPASHCKASSSLSRKVPPEVYATQAIRIEVEIADEINEQQEELAVELHQARKAELSMSPVEKNDMETGRDQGKPKSQKEPRSIIDHPQPDVDAQTCINVDLDQHKSSSQQDCGELSASADESSASKGIKMKTGITLESIQELLVVLAPSRCSLLPTTIPSDVRPSSLSSKSRHLSPKPYHTWRPPISTTEHYPEVIEVDADDDDDDDDYLSKLRQAPAVGVTSAATQRSTLSSSKPWGSPSPTLSSPRIPQPNHRKRKGNNPYPPAEKVARKTGPGC